MKMKKTLTLILALVLIASLAVGGTLAYFTWQSDEHVNTFQVSGTGVDVVDPDPTDPEIDIEDKWDEEEEHPLDPGAVYAKNPEVTLGAESVDAWIIFKVEEVNNYTESGDKAVLWNVRDEWTEIQPEGADATDKVYYYAMSAASVAGDNAILFKDADGGIDTDGEVQVNPALSEDDITYLLGGKTENTVELKITAYAIQATAGETAVKAFNNAVAKGDIKA